MTPRFSVVILFACLASLSIRAADEIQPPFDPAPLMAKLAESRKEDKFTFVVLGDTKHATNFSKKVVPLVEKLAPDFVLTTGDMVQVGGGEKGPTWWKALSAEAGAAMRARPWWPAVGNHELGTGAKSDAEKEAAKKHISGDDAFKTFYNLKETYYSFEFRNSAFVALPWKQPKDDQLKWLEGELKKYRDAGKLIFVFNHCPFYTLGNKTVDDVPNKPTEVTALFEKYGVTAVFSGHDHIYYRTVRGGIPYVISAGGGAGIYTLKRKAEALPEDVYYGGAPPAKEGDKTTEFLLNNQITKKTKTEKAAEHFVCIVTVDGKNVSMKTITSTEEVWDEMVLSKGK